MQPQAVYHSYMATSSMHVWWMLAPVHLAIAGLAIRHLVRIGLHRMYPVVMIFLVLDTAANLLSWLFSIEGKPSAQCYLFSVSPYFYPVIYFWLCPAVFKELFRRYPGLLAARRRRLVAWIYGGTGAALSLTLLALMNWAPLAACGPAILVEFQNVTSFGCGVFILGFCALALKLPAEVPPNTKHLACSLGVELLGSGVLAFWGLRSALAGNAADVDACNALIVLLLAYTRSCLLRTVKAVGAESGVAIEERTFTKEHLKRLRRSIATKQQACTLETHAQRWKTLHN
jgi:hypothetical protein